jgi:hypothetical protein
MILNFILGVSWYPRDEIGPGLSSLFNLRSVIHYMVWNHHISGDPNMIKLLLTSSIGPSAYSQEHCCDALLTLGIYGLNQHRSLLGSHIILLEYVGISDIFPTEHSSHVYFCTRFQLWKRTLKFLRNMNLMCFLGARMENQAAYHPHFRMDLASGPTCRRAIKRAAV